MGARRLGFAFIIDYMFPPDARRARIWLSWVTPLLLLLPYQGFAADLTFSGSLVRVGHESISLKLADRRVIDARLPNKSLLAAGTMAAHYKLGDQIQIACTPIRPVWEEATSRYQSLEVTSVRLLRRASPEELSRMLELPPFREGENLLNRPNAAGPAPKGGLDTQRAIVDGLDATALRKLEHARQVNLEYASSLPNFVADETAKRYTSDSRSPDWRYADTI
jgi:hypothetical protein